MTTIKFTGKFKDLKARGYTFHEMFAMNYRAYHKKDIDLWIFVAKRSIEISDYFDDSHLIISQLLNSEDGHGFYCGRLRFGLDLKELKIISRVDYKLIKYNEVYSQVDIMDDERLHAFYDRYREISLASELQTELKKLKKEGLIEIGD